MRVKSTTCCTLILITVLLGLGAMVAAMPEKPTDYVSDYAHLLAPQDVQAISSYLGDYEKATTNQIFVAIVPSLEGMTIEDYSIRLAEKWKVGEKGKDNGVIFLIAANEHKMRIEVGYGLEGKLTDVTSGEIIRDIVAPKFREGQFAEGVALGVQAVTEKIEGKPFQELSLGSNPSNETARTPSLISIIVFLILLFIFFSRFGLWWLPLTLLGGGSGGGWRGGSGGDGFSGGGGGSFGGGGASGSW